MLFRTACSDSSADTYHVATIPLLPTALCLHNRRCSKTTAYSKSLTGFFFSSHVWFSRVSRRCPVLPRRSFSGALPSGSGPILRLRFRFPIKSVPRLWLFASRPNGHSAFRFRFPDPVPACLASHAHALHAKPRFQHSPSGTAPRRKLHPPNLCLTHFKRVPLQAKLKSPCPSAFHLAPKPFQAPALYRQHRFLRRARNGATFIIRYSRGLVNT